MKLIMDQVLARFKPLIQIKPHLDSTFNSLKSVNTHKHTDLTDYAYRLKFSGELEGLFQDFYHHHSIVMIRGGLSIFACFYALFGILDIWALPLSMGYSWWIRYVIVCPLIITVLLLSFLPSFKKVSQPILLLLVLIGGLGVIAMLANAHPEEIGYTSYYVGLILIIMGSHTLLRLSFFYATTLGWLIVIFYGTAAIFYQQLLASSQGILLLFNNMIFLTSSNIIGMLTSYLLEFYARSDFLRMQTIEFEQGKSEKLLLNVLPEEIALMLKEDNKIIAEEFSAASILFADIVGFTHISEQLTPQDLIELLDEIFSWFDKLVEKYSLEKIKTIGDCYMVAAGVPTPRPDHAQALACLALEMLDYSKNFMFQNGRQVNLRIGINSGSVIAGVIGRKKFAYDLWGDTVNTASRMESHGLAGKIQLPRSTYELLKDTFVCEPQGTLLIKGKGEMEVWHLLGKRSIEVIVR